MQESFDVFLTIAEVSVAFAGFSGIITAVAGRNSERMNPGNLTRFRLMVYSSLSATLLCLLPFLLFLNFGEVNWKVCVFSLALFLIGFLTILIRLFIRQVSQGQLSGTVAFGVAFLGVSATITQVIACLGFVEADAGIYLIGVFFLLVGSGISFIRLVTGFLTVQQNQ